MNEKEIEALEREAARQMAAFRQQEAEAIRGEESRPIVDGDAKRRAIALNEMLSRREPDAANKSEIERLKFELNSASKQQEGGAAQQQEIDAAAREIAAFEREAALQIAASQEQKSEAFESEFAALEREAARQMADFRQQEADALRAGNPRPIDEDRARAIELDAMLSKQEADAANKSEVASRQIAASEKRQSEFDRQIEALEREAARQMAAFRQQEADATRMGKSRRPMGDEYSKRKAIALDAALERQRANATNRGEIAALEREVSRQMAGFLKQQADHIKVGYGRSTGDGYSIVDGKRCRGYVRGPAIALKFGAEYIAIQMSKLERR